jgi:hypothetical protein
MKEKYIEKPTQEQRILDLLRWNKHRWVWVHRFMRLWIAQYNARIFWLRRKWYQIMQKFDIKDRTKSFYMLIESNEK